MSGWGTSAVHVTQQPKSAVVVEGHAHTLSVSFARRAVVQWYKDGQPLPGATNRTLSLAYPLEGDAGAYHATMTRGTNTVQTATADVEVRPLVRVFADGVEVHDWISPWSGQTVTIRPWRASEAVWYTLDGSEPTELSTLYTGPLRPSNAALLRMMVGKLEANPLRFGHERRRQTTD